MIIRNCKILLTELHDLEEKLEELVGLHPDLDLDLLLELINHTYG